MIRGIKKVFFLPDTHVPYHNQSAFKIALKALNRFQPDVLVILGDFADFYSVSSHDKSPNRVAYLQDEIKAVRQCLSRIERLDIPRKIYLSGNHEYRLERYIMTKAPELFGMVETDKLFKLYENNWEYIPYRKQLKLGNLVVSHDYGSSGQSAHRTAAAKLGSSVIIGHTHRCATISRNNIHGQLLTAAMFGWLGDVTKIDYANQASMAAEWVTGFGVGYIHKDGTPILQSIPIVNNTCILEGALIK